jgi:hypothetical protein
MIQAQHLEYVEGKGLMGFHHTYRCAQVGPLKYAPAAADGVAWAHYFYMVHRQCTRMGPLKYAEAAFNG